MSGGAFAPTIVGGEPGKIDGIRSNLNTFYEIIKPRFARAEPRRRARDYLCGLVGLDTRRNGRRLAEYAGENRPDGMQRLLTSALWDEDEVCEDLRRFVSDRRSPASLMAASGGVVSVVEAGFVKKGRRSVGVRRQYNPSTGRMENCQLGLFLLHSGGRCPGLLLDRELYLPRSWLDDRSSRRRAGVPEGLGYRSRARLAWTMLDRTLATVPPVNWVVAEQTHIYDGRLRTGLEERRVPYLFAVDDTETLPVLTADGDTALPPSMLARRAPVDAWQQVRGRGRTGYGGYRGASLWARLPLGSHHQRAFAQWLLLRRPAGRAGVIRHYLAFAHHTTTLEEMVAALESEPADRSLRLARERAGLDRYEVRQWRGWYRHITLAMAAHACVVLGTEDALARAG